MDYVDIIGAGFVLGVPGLYANCRVYYDHSGVRHVGPLYQEWSELVEVSQPAAEPEPAQLQETVSPAPARQRKGSTL